jgi:hypothetical protein
MSPDVDCDSQLTGTDSVLILEYAAGMHSRQISGCPRVGTAHESAGARYHGDLDCNGSVDTRDALVVLKAIADGVPEVACS